MTHMEQIKTAIRGDEFFSRSTQLLCALSQLIHIHDFCVHRLLTTKSSARGRIWKTVGSLPTSSPSALNHIPGSDRTEIFFARRKVTESLERCLPKSISAASSAVSAAERFGTRDRKSTRLNSSHSQISYAVFCLKKKN